MNNVLYSTTRLDASSEIWNEAHICRKDWNTRADHMSAGLTYRSRDCIQNVPVGSDESNRHLNSLGTNKVVARDESS